MFLRGKWFRPLSTAWVCEQQRAGRSPRFACWDSSLGRPGPVEIATTGQFGGKVLGLQGVASSSGNHAKIGVSLSGTHHYAIFWRYEPARRSFWKLQQQPKRKRGFVLRD